MPCAPRSHLASGDRDRDDDQDPARPVSVHRRSSPPTSRSRSEFEFRKRTPVKLIRFRFICEKPRIGPGRKEKKKKKRRLISRGGFVRNLRTMLCTPLWFMCIISAFHATFASLSWSFALRTSCTSRSTSTLHGSFRFLVGVVIDPAIPTQSGQTHMRPLRNSLPLPISISQSPSPNLPLPLPLLISFSQSPSSSWSSSSSWGWSWSS